MSDTTGGGRVTQKPPWHLWPESKPGWWAIGLACAFAVFFILNGPLFMSGLVRLDQVTGPIWAVVWFGTGAAAGVLGIIAMTARKDRSVLLFLPVLPLAFVVVFLVGESVFPH